jgi:post-segregation antitoxin (ccd killing protein)
VTYAPSGPKRAVELMLSEDLIRDAETLLGDVSAAVEQALTRVVAREMSLRDPEEQKRVDEFLALSNEFYEKHGVWGEEFSTL